MPLSSSNCSQSLRLLAALLGPTAAITPPIAAQSKPLPQRRRPFSTAKPFLQDPRPFASSVSETEVSHFSRLAASWWDPHGSSRLLHLMNPLRHDFISSCLQSAPDSAGPGTKYSYLDIGCGGGIFASSAARLRSTKSVIAIDPTPSIVAVAKAHQRSDPALSEPKLRYLNCAIEDLPLPSLAPENASESAADIITLFEVLEHINSPSQFLRNTIQHLKPGGWLIGSTIARSPLSFLTTKLIAEAPLIGVVPRGTHDWDKYINPSELAEWFEEDGGGRRWASTRMQGMIYLPGVGWKMVDSSEGYGNYFFGVRNLA
jgi:polyprenyldihydroxybenzoate methyltransferase / 3-demethylubiquinol 3-O-methyltransferase